MSHLISLWIPLATFFASIVRVQSGGHTYSLSTTYLDHLSRIELKLYPRFKEYAKNLRGRIQLTQEYISDYEESESGSTRWEVPAHPLASYRLIRRFASILSPLSGSINEDLELLGYLTQPPEGGLLGYPDMVDQGNSMGSILRLQDIYNLDANDLVEGVFQDLLETNIGLTPRQTLEFAEYGLDMEYFTLAWDWLTALKKSQRTNISGLTDEITLLTNSLIELHNLDFNRNNEQGHKFIFNQPLRNSSSPVKNERQGAEGENTTRYLQICRGANLQSEAEKSFLRCYLDSSRNPFFILQPLKIEQLSSTGLLLFHQIVPAGWINRLKAVSLPLLEEEKLPDSYPKHGLDATPIPLGFSWPSTSDTTEALQKRIEIIFGLNVQKGAGEKLRVALYGSGGQMALHNDAYPPGNGYEDRLATFLLYMSNVELGGITAFPNLGLGIKPTEGSALFWENYDPWGNEIDFSKLHGGCPVMVGVKWYATQWINLSANNLKHPCQT